MLETILSSASRTVVISVGKPTVMIGERINTKGNRHLSIALGEGNYENLILREAKSQVEAGADVLDINVASGGLDETDLLHKTVRLVMESVEVPVCIDSVNAEALGAALFVHKDLAPEGKALVNSVNGKESSLEQILPLIAEYEAAVIGLPIDKDGIPSTAKKRTEVACKIVKRAEDLGIHRENVVIDCLALTVGADSQAAQVTLETIRMVRQELGVNLSLGGSNVSFGLPEREVVNSAFLSMAIQNGVNCPIVDVAKTRRTILAADLLLGRDEYGARYIQAYRETGAKNK